ncbi:hypothetical protein GCM10028805_03920 [Spirosoma harenae]
MASSVTFFGAILLYELKKEKLLYVFLTGFLFSLAFYFRFQLAFGLLGFGLWLVFIEKKYTHLLPIAVSFLIGVGINVGLDYLFYHQFVFTPYDYFRVNILEGKAASFGTSSPVWYILMLTLVIGAPPLSIFLFYYSLKGAIKHYRQPIGFAVVFFVLGHSLVGHKEERFLFPILNVLPVIAGWGLASFIDYYRQTNMPIRNGIKGVFYVSVALNTFVLILLPILNPYYQTIAFGRKLTDAIKQDNPTIYCLTRTPFETENHLPLTFYRRNAARINLVRITNADSARYLKNAWLATTYNDAKNKLPLFTKLGFKPQFYSSTILWNVNKYLASKKVNTINEIWVLYKKE